MSVGMVSRQTNPRGRARSPDCTDFPETSFCLKITSAGPKLWFFPVEGVHILGSGIAKQQRRTIRS